MKRKTSLFSTPQKKFAFLAGSGMVTTGVVLHLPMFLMGRYTQYRLVGMRMSMGMLIGMGLIVVGIGAAAYGLLPNGPHRRMTGASIAPPEDARLTKAHWIQMGLLAMALVIDVMKAATLGFVTPGMRAEYGLSFSAVAVLPFVALMGTTVGSFIWGALADIYGRRAAILLAAVMFVGTSICGTMPSFSFNILMCFMMGLAAGGMLPVANALIAEIMPTKHRGWCLVLLGGIGAIGGYFATSEASALLQPYFGWRIMWLLGFPTGLILIVMSSLLPESARFLMEMGRVEEAREMLARYGGVITTKADSESLEKRTTERYTNKHESGGQPNLRPLLGLGIALTLTAVAIGFVNFGILLWLPSSLMAGGRSVGLASTLIAKSTLISIPTVALTTYLYTVWSTKRVLIVAIGVTTVGLLASLSSNNKVPFLSNPLIFVSLLIVGTGAVISILMPYSAENFPIRLRGRATGWVAGCSKFGGVMAQGLASLALVPAFALAALAIAIPTIASLVLVAVFGHETRGRDLRELEMVSVPVPGVNEAIGAD